ncbi:MAG: hypothetical protein ACHBN1_14055 [Heteroscytonema crispum UTEX LB 1556]
MNDQKRSLKLLKFPSYPTYNQQIGLLQHCNLWLSSMVVSLGMEIILTAIEAKSP